jgi:hypothetical protein
LKKHRNNGLRRSSLLSLFTEPPRKEAFSEVHIQHPA